MNFLLETVDYTKPLGSFGEQLSFGGEMLLLGMATVFAVLCTIWLALVLFKLAFNKAPKASKEAKPQAIVSPVAVSTSQSTDEAEIVAVIAAAIAMAESDESGIKFRVVSFKKR